MLRMCNKYCSNCLKTQRFLDLGSYLVCERCSKRLERIAATPLRIDAKTDSRPAFGIVPWMERGDVREAM